MGIIGSTTGSNKAVRCKYISPILYTALDPIDSHNRGKAKEIDGRIHANRKLTIQIREKRKAPMAFDDKFDYLYGIVTTDRAFQIYYSKDIVLTEKIMKDDAELRRGVKYYG
ncbi:30177_t:CDS:2, partial [Gigaspora margarita]